MLRFLKKVKFSSSKILILTVAMYLLPAVQMIYSEEITPDYIKRLNDEAKENAKNIELPKMPDVNSREYKEAQEIYKKQKEYLPTVSASGEKIQGESLSGQTQNEQIYLFISSSIPTQTLKNYAATIHEKKLPIIMVLRGFVGDISKMKPTMEFIQSFTANGEKRFNAPIQIDPLLFRRFEVTQVPTFILAKNINLEDPDLSAGSAENNKAPVDAEKILGDVSLDYVIEKFKKQEIKDEQKK